MKLPLAIRLGNDIFSQCSGLVFNSAVTIVKRLSILLLIVAGAILILLLRDRIGWPAAETARTVRVQKTVEDRLAQYGDSARRRLLPYFEEAQAPYPPDKLVFVGVKQEKKLEVWAAGVNGQFKLIRAYSILGASGRLGPKLREGDRQVPEGIYRIESLNPNSKYHLSMRINYPNEFDRAHAKEENRANLGGDIMIHGGRASIGCIAMGDEAIEDLFILAAETGIERITVILTPVDLRKTELPALPYPLPEWTAICYDRIKQQLSSLTPN